MDAAGIADGVVVVVVVAEELANVADEQGSYKPCYYWTMRKNSRVVQGQEGEAFVVKCYPYFLIPSWTLMKQP